MEPPPPSSLPPLPVDLRSAIRVPEVSFVATLALAPRGRLEWNGPRSSAALPMDSCRPFRVDVRSSDIVEALLWT